MRRKRLGFLVNPIAGMGGAVGLKGTDGPALAEALRRGAKPSSPRRAAEALGELARIGAGLDILAAGGEMGATQPRRPAFPLFPLMTRRTAPSRRRIHGAPPRPCVRAARTCSSSREETARHGTCSPSSGPRPRSSAYRPASKCTGGVRDQPAQCRPPRRRLPCGRQHGPAARSRDHGPRRLGGRGAPLWLCAHPLRAHAHPARQGDKPDPGRCRPRRRLPAGRAPDRRRPLFLHRPRHDDAAHQAAARRGKARCSASMSFTRAVSPRSTSAKRSCWRFRRSAPPGSSSASWADRATSWARQSAVQRPRDRTGRQGGDRYRRDRPETRVAGGESCSSIPATRPSIASCRDMFRSSPVPTAGPCSRSLGPECSYRGIADIANAAAPCENRDSRQLC